MAKFYPQDVESKELYSLLLSSVVPRPIAFVSSMDNDGIANLSPYSYFNIFSMKPPILIFSPVTRMRDSTDKDTLHNVKAHPEVVISMVNHKIVEQMSLSSTEYPKEVNEFEKAGLTQVESELVKPPRVGESPISFECKVNDVIPLGSGGGAGNLVICEIVLIHIADKAIAGKVIDPLQLDMVARMGGDWYTRVGEDSLFEVTKPASRLGIGVDSIPEEIRNSTVLTGNNLGKLGGIEQIPSPHEIEEFRKNPVVSEIIVRIENEQEERNTLHMLAQKYLEEDDVYHAWLTLLQE